MTRLPASATAGDRHKVGELLDDASTESNDSTEGVIKKEDTYTPGPSREGDPGWSDGFSFGGSEWIR